MKFATTATIVAAALAMSNPAEARLRGRRMDMDDSVGGRCQIPPNCRIVKTCSEYDARCRHLTCNSEPPNREFYARGCGPVSIRMPWGVWVIPGEEEDSWWKPIRANAPFNTFADEDDSVGNANLQHILSDHCGTMCRHNRDEDDSVGNAPRPRPRDI